MKNLFSKNEDSLIEHLLSVGIALGTEHTQPH
jgi:hypothetical protein